MNFRQFRIQLIGLILLVTGAGLYCLSDGDCSLLTPDQQGYRLFQQQKYELAETRFNDIRWKGIVLFRQGEFEQAASLFAGYDTADSAFNQGNALVMQGKYDAAMGRYSRALQLNPGWDDAEINLEIARARAEMLKRKGGEGTGGQLGADDIVFEKGKAPPSAGEEQVQDGQGMDQAELQAIWLRQVQTKPTDFLRSKFSYQYAMAGTQADSR